VVPDIALLHKASDHVMLPALSVSTRGEQWFLSIALSLHHLRPTPLTSGWTNTSGPSLLLGFLASEALAGSVCGNCHHLIGATTPMAEVDTKWKAHTHCSLHHICLNC
jgi:hypothetical protein